MAAVSVFQDVRDELVGKLVAAGIAATTDPRAVPPCVIVSLPTSSPPAVGVGAWPAEFPVWIVSPPPDDDNGGRWRLAQLQAIFGVLGWTGAYHDRWGDRDAPAYRLLYPVTVPNPDC